MGRGDEGRITKQDLETIMEKIQYIAPEMTVIALGHTDSFLISASVDGKTILDYNNEGTSDGGVTEADVKASIFEENPWE